MKRIAILIFIILLGCTSDRLPETVETMPVASTAMELSEDEFTARGLQFVNVSKQNFGSVIRVSGYIDVPPEGRASVSPFYGGYVKHIHLVPGQKVEKSELLLVIEHPDFINAQRDYIQVKERLIYLKDDYERQKILLEENINSRKSFLKAESDYKQAQARYTALREQLRLMGLNIAKIENGVFTSEISLYSPIDGYVTEVHAVQGQFLPAASRAVDLINTDHLHLELRVYEKDITSVKEDQTIRVRLPGTDTYIFGKVYLIGKEISSEERAVDVHAHLDETDSLTLNPGLFLETDIFLEESFGMALPSGAISENSIWVTKTSDWPLKLEKMSIKTGRTSGKFTELISEIKPGYRILSGF